MLNIQLLNVSNQQRADVDSDSELDYQAELWGPSSAGLERWRLARRRNLA